MTEQALKPGPEPERRKLDRLTVLWSATLISGDQHYNCVIVNISNTGAMLRLAESIACYPSIMIECSRFGRLAAEVSWRKGNEIGVRFSAEQDEVAQTLSGLLP